MTILDGKKLSEKILENLGKEIKSHHSEIKLAVILVGTNPVSQIFINQKKIFCERVGVNFKLYKFSAEIGTKKLRKEIKKIIKKPDISGVIIQLPLPKRFIPEEFLNLIPEEKDVDVLSEKSLGKFYQGRSKILSPMVSGIRYLLKSYQIRTKGKNVVIVGAGRLVGQPLVNHFLSERATVSVLNQFTKDTLSFTKKADILISGVGKPNLITGRMVKKGAVVIDAGSALQNGKIVGDTNFKSVSKKASFVTPVPGGVGPMTVACLIENLVKLQTYELPRPKGRGIPTGKFLRRLSSPS